MRGLGRLHQVDHRDDAYPLTALLPDRLPSLTTRYWTAGLVLDQGQTSECVAYAWKQWLDSSPVRDPWRSPPSPEDIYAAAQAVDEWAGKPHEGTTVRAGAKVMQANGRLGAYHWSRTVADIRAYVLSSGPVVLGTDWYESMFDPEHNGRVNVSGRIAGGHAYLCIGWSEHRQWFRCVNSWGTAWGDHGRFWIAASDLTNLMAANGEACAAAELPR